MEINNVQHKWGIPYISDISSSLPNKFEIKIYIL